MSRADVSVIVPVAPGDVAWTSLVPLLRAAGFRECLLVFAGDAPDLRAAPGLRVIHAPRGRARQLNAGALASSAPVLWFLHADSLLGDAAFAALDRHLGEGARGLGYFDLAFAADGPRATRLNALGATVRSRVFGLPFGDQGFVIRRSEFDRLGGFPDVDGEDHAFVWRARRAGLTLRALGAPITTSARKYADRGWWRTTRQHGLATLRQALAFSRDARRRARGPSPAVERVP